MPLTIRDAMKFGGLFGATVLAGEAGLDHIIESVSVLEIAETQISRWVIQNQMYITSFYAIWDNIDMQKTVIRTLADCGCCALVLCNLGMWIRQVDPSILELCDEVGFPLLAARDDVSYIEIQEPIMNVLFQEDQGSTPDADCSNLRRDLLDIIINESDTRNVFQAMAARMRRRISFYDIYCREIYSNKDDACRIAEAAYISKNFNRLLHYCGKSGYMPVVIAGRRQLVSLIRSRKNLFGVLSVDDAAGALAGDEEEIGQLMLSCALVLSRRERMTDLREREIEEYIGDLIVWNFPSDRTAIRRGEEIGYHITNKDRVVLMNINSIQSPQAGNSGEVQDYIRTSVLPEVQRVLNRCCPGGEAAFRSDTILLLFQDSVGDEGVAELCAALLALFGGQPRVSVSIGVSNRFQQVSGIPGAYMEAFNAAMLGRSYYGENRVTFYEEIWFLQKLHDLGEDEQAQRVCAKLLEPIADHDATYHTDLMDAFRRLLHTGGNVSQVAREMFVHKNTMLQRKNKIMELLGCNPFEMPHLLNYLMAMAVMQSDR